MAIAGEVRIKVDSTVLRDKADAVRKSINLMEEQFMQLEQLVNKTSYYWIGEAGDMHRKTYKDQKQNIEDMLKRLKEHPADLVAIALNYEETEAQLQSLAAELPGDIIS